MDKPAIKKFAIWARNKLIADTKYRAGLVGVTETAVAEPLPQSNETVQFFDVGLPQPYRIEGDAVTQRQRFVAELNKETAKQGSYTAAYQTVVDKVAYTWFNRLIAVRYMEVNDLLPSRTRVLSSADGRAEPQIVTSPFDAVLFGSDDAGEVSLVSPPAVALFEPLSSFEFIIPKSPTQIKAHTAILAAAVAMSAPTPKRPLFFG